MTMPPATGNAPPDSPVPWPRATNGTPSRAHALTTACTSAVVAVAATAPALQAGPTLETADLARHSAEGATAEATATGRTTIALNVNGAARRLQVEDRWTLVEALRDHLGLTGTKIGCDRGE